jgi:multiple sugar transport system ATP-binding protein
MTTIQLRHVEKNFGDLHAVRPMDLTIQDGEFVVLLGPSGCGKTTTLRMIAGLETVTGGTILVNGKDITWEPAAERDIAMVFQLFALYPHMSVWGNVAFPLQAQGVPRQKVRQRVDEVLQTLGIDGLRKLRPGALSGGDQQRVALARALVRRPAAFLMDEPIGALDADLRGTMRAEIKRFHLSQAATTVYVTHDQIEAMAMGDRIVVMSEAVVQQVGTPSEVYHNPANLFVANFIGSPGMNLIVGRYAQGVVHLPGDNSYRVPPRWRPALDAGLSDDQVIVGFRPEAAAVGDEGTLRAEVYSDDLHGAYTMMHLSLHGPEQIVHIRGDRSHIYPIGAETRFDLDPEMVRFFDPKTEQALAPEVNHG